MNTSKAGELATFFRQRPDVWIDGRDLEFAGRYAWRSRVADVRRQPYGLDIRNRLRRITRPDGSMYLVSEYRCVGVKQVDGGNQTERASEETRPVQSLF